MVESLFTLETNHSDPNYIGIHKTFAPRRDSAGGAFDGIRGRVVQVRFDQIFEMWSSIGVGSTTCLTHDSSEYEFSGAMFPSAGAPYLGSRHSESCSTFSLYVPNQST